jgi:MFS family permease
MTAPAPPALSTAGRYVVLICAFLGWFCAGFHLSISSLAMRPAAVDLLARTGELDAARYQKLIQVAPKKATDRSTMSASEEAEWTVMKTLVARWFDWLTCAFLFGAASGGLIFGRLGDRFGRSKAMAWSILTYSLMAGAASMSQSPWQLLVLWYLACTGVGGMWPNGVALVSEAWSSLSRPAAAGVIGTSANIGIFLVSTMATQKSRIAKWPIWDSISPESLPSAWHVGVDGSFLAWRWLPVVGAIPLALGVFSLLFVPESPRWLATRGNATSDPAATPTRNEIFRRPLLSITLIGIALATIPMIGGWGSANWMVPWAGEVGEALSPPDKDLGARVQQARSFAGLVGSLLGGWIASQLGRRQTYFLASLLCLVCAQYTFWFLTPADRGWFLAGVGAVGFFSGIYFGWLPLCLPELFPTRVRSVGAGVSFNFSRIFTAFTLVATGLLMEFFGGDYAKIGRVTSLCFALGLVLIWLAPDTSDKQLED